MKSKRGTAASASGCTTGGGGDGGVLTPSHKRNLGSGGNNSLLLNNNNNEKGSNSSKNSINNPFPLNIPTISTSTMCTSTATSETSSPSPGFGLGLEIPSILRSLNPDGASISAGDFPSEEEGGVNYSSRNEDTPEMNLHHANAKSTPFPEMGIGMSNNLNRTSSPSAGISSEMEYVVQKIAALARATSVDSTDSNANIKFDSTD